MPIEIDVVTLAQSLAYFIAAYTIVTLSLNLEAGFTGVPNFGKHLFVAAGAFVVASIGNRLSAYIVSVLYKDEIIKLIQEDPLLSRRITEEDIGRLWSMYADPLGNRDLDRIMDKFFAQNPELGIIMFMLIVVLAVAIGGLMGLLISYPALRLRGEYLAILLLAAAEMVVMAIGYYWKPLVGGTTGLFLPRYLAVFGQKVILGVTILLILTALAMYIYAQRIANSPAGRMMRAVRDDELAAASLGKDIARVRRDVIIISSAMAALAGALIAIHTGSVVSTHYQRFSWTFIPWAMMIVGGVANNSGVVIGVALVMILQKFVDIVKPLLAPIVPFDPVWLYQIGLGLIIILMLYMRPQGIIPEKPSRTLNFEEVFEDILEDKVEDEQAKKMIREGRATP
ncbi:MAG: branched-chain amino acid ABC transporter permease [Desulfurococcales archaeon]|nr:branched-chain amino acid ABC transporter permease [Desulfurococcales archaeon]MCE4605229.1 branched-chain amino acid ABC transporter permease [Desulfurococcales archaeon]